MFRLTSQTSIGGYVMRGGINSVNIRRSVHEIVDTALIKIPAIGRVNGKDTQPMTSIETSKLWKEGDPVLIMLGYNNDNRQEFKGFVRRVNPSIPVAIECEGYAWQLRRKYLNKAWKNITVKALLKELTGGTDIKVHPLVPDIPLTNFNAGQFPNCLKTLEYMRDRLHLAVFFQFDILYVGLIEGVPGATINYRLGWNVSRDDQLTYRTAEDTRVMIRLFGPLGKASKKPIVEVGDKDGSVVNYHIPNVMDKAHLLNIANDMLRRRKYTGYEGNITGFAQPFCQPSDVANITDRQYNERGGAYFVEGIEIRFGMNGAQRIVHIGPTVSNNNTTN